MDKFTLGKANTHELHKKAALGLKLSGRNINLESKNLALKFNPCQERATREVGIRANFRGYAPELAKDTYEQVRDLLIDYPEITPFIKWISTSQGWLEERERRLGNICIGIRVREEGMNLKQAKRATARGFKELRQEFDAKVSMALRSSSSKKRAIEKVVDLCKKEKELYFKIPENEYGATVYGIDEFANMCGIIFNGNSVKTKKINETILRAGRLENVHPIGVDSHKSMVTHEFGHWIYNYLNSLGLLKFVLDDTIINMLNFNKNFVRKYLGRYSLTNPEEFFAEAFAEYKHNPNPRIIARIIGKRVDRLFKMIRENTYGVEEMICAD